MPIAAKKTNKPVTVREARRRDNVDRFEPDIVKITCTRKQHMRDLHSTKASLARPYCSMPNAFTQFTQNHQPEKPFLNPQTARYLRPTRTLKPRQVAILTR